MKKLSTIQKSNNLNQVIHNGIIGNGNANHEYAVVTTNNTDKVLLDINFQQGGRNTAGSIDGVLNEDLLEIVRHRLIGFQSGLLRTRESALALTAVEEALLWMNKRTEDRNERNVLGTQQK